MMRAVLIKEFGGPEQLYIGNHEKPNPGEGELLVKVEATTLNRADTLQRKGAIPPVPGASEILGLEAAGTIEAVGPNCGSWKVGDRVTGLLSGGGYAQYCLMHHEVAILVPENFSLVKGNNTIIIF